MTERQKGQEYSGEVFLRDFEKLWGGKLFFAINPHYNPMLTDISSLSSAALEKIYDLDSRISKFPVDQRTGNIASDLKNHLILTMPHSQEAKNRIHILACPFCRGIIAERLETFFQVCSKVPPDTQPFTVMDELPFKLDGEDNIVFKIDILVPKGLLLTIEDYLEGTKLEADDLSKTLDLTEDERMQFVWEFNLTIERYKNYTKLAELNEDENLHPMIKTISRIALFLFLVKSGR